MCNSKGCSHRKKARQRLIIGVNDLATTHPDVAALAHGWDPRTVTAGSGKMMRFRCDVGHLPAPTHVYVKAKFGAKSCKICSGKEVLIGYNDLKTTHPKIAKQAYGWDPKTLTAGSDKPRQFKCRFGHVSSPRPVSRKVKNGLDSCAICSNKEVLSGYNDLATTHPDLARQLVGIDPATIIAGTDELLRWKCKCGFIWLATGYNRSSGEKGCKKCAKTGFNPKTPSFFYIVKKSDRFKLGIGNHGARRLDTHRNAGWELVESIDMSGCAAWELEKRLKATFIANGIPLGQFRETFDGYTESWYKHDLEVRTIRQLCRKLRVNLAEFLAM